MFRLYKCQSDSNCVNRNRLLQFARSSLFLLCLWPVLTSAMVTVNLFEVTIPVVDESQAVRQEALTQGLSDVLIKISGDRQVLNKLTVPPAGPYVQQYRYTALSPAELKSGAEKSSGNEKAVSHRLWITYNGTRIMELLRQNEIPVWSEHRSEVVIWLAVRDGKNQYILKESDSSPIKSAVQRVPRRRGIPLIWPRYDNNDRTQVTYTDIRAGFSGQIEMASQRYSSGPIIAINLGRSGNNWLLDASLIMDGNSRRWNYQGRKYSVLLSQAMNELVDAMAKEFAVVGSRDTSRWQRLLVEFEGVNSVDGYRLVEKSLTSMPVVKSALLAQLESERVIFQLDLRAEVDQFLNQLRNSRDFMELPSANLTLNPSQRQSVYRFQLKQ